MPNVDGYTPWLHISLCEVRPVTAQHEVDRLVIDTSIPIGPTPIEGLVMNQNQNQK